MHILYIISPGGGPEAYTKIISPWLLKKGHSVSIIFVTGPKQQKLIYPEDVNVYYVSPTKYHYYLSKVLGGFRNWPLRLRSVESERAVRKVLKRIDSTSTIDLIEVTEDYPVSWLSKRRPVLVRAHGSAWAFRDQCQDGDRTYDSFLVNQASKQFSLAGKVSPLSRDYAKTLSEICDLPMDAFSPIPYPIDTHIFSPEGEAAELQGKPVLMSIGRLEHRKGTDVLVRSMNRVWEEFQDARLLLLGKLAGFTKDDLLSLVPESKRDQIVFPGFIEHSKIPAYLRAVDLYLTPTQYETLGYTILEAMACGKAVISCNVGAVPELISHGENGLLVPFGDHERLSGAIIKLLKDQKLRSELEAAARKKAEQYRMSVICPQFETLYKSTIKNWSKG